jgi:competence protein ComEA
MGSRFAKPAARVVLVASGLVLLALVGRSAGAIGPSGPTPSTTIAPDAAVPSPRVDPAAASSTVPAAIVASPEPAAPAAPPSPPAPHSAASPDDPVVLNTATSEDLRRLPGIGQKRADAILALRGHLGRFRALEDLLKVKGLGRATLKRIRPLVRLD